MVGAGVSVGVGVGGGVKGAGVGVGTAVGPEGGTKVAAASGTGVVVGNEGNDLPAPRECKECRYGSYGRHCQLTCYRRKRVHLYRHLWS